MSLLPCPFCGSGHQFISDVGITCRGCHTQVCGAGTVDDITAWNTRAHLPAPETAAGADERGFRAALTMIATAKPVPEHQNILLDWMQELARRTLAATPAQSDEAKAEAALWRDHDKRHNQQSDEVK